ncbi:hypothetical protein [Chitinimonas sp. BJYL2]|uniref:hypothetical protein n=1 Tax=Chitinimonas sp. BJYL2 TaxID=2976696 RepID=UPI0022B52A80|nr:hypothetical protein [Chitinimonas sp. BJYL2]
MKKSILTQGVAVQGLIALLLVPASLTTHAAESAEKAILVTQAEGDVQLGGKQKGKRLEAFSQLYLGDRLDLGKGARLQIAWTGSGRQETWQGPVSLQIKAESASSQPATVTPQVKQLPAVIRQALLKTPAVVSEVKQLSGVLYIRSGTLAEALSDARNNYAMLRKDAPESDLTPEIYLFTRLVELRQYQEARKVLEDAKAKQPGNAEIAAMANQLNAQLGDE